MAQSRLPAFYGDLGVPDTLEGRFELLTLHMFLALSGLEGEETRWPVAQALVDAFFADMDTIMRETGVGDMAVPKRMRELAAAFYERLRDYRQGTQEREGLAPVIARHILKKPGDPRAEPIAAYARDTLAAPRPAEGADVAEEIVFATLSDTSHGSHK